MIMAGLVLGLGAATPHHGVAQGGATATIAALPTQGPHPDVTIQALQTQMALLPPTPPATPVSEQHDQDGAFAPSAPFTVAGHPYQMGETVPVMGAVDIVVTGTKVFAALGAMQPRGEFLVVLVDLTYRIRTERPYAQNFFVVVDRDGTVYHEVKVPPEPLPAEQARLNHALGLAYEPGQVVHEALTFDVPRAADICYLSDATVGDQPHAYAVVLGC
jgi:hypothetical protein